jgi:glycosyltransferase involved in cell wall biosynthesis
MTTALKVLMLVENLPVPPDPRIWAEATTLRDHGFQVSVICPKGSSQHQESYVCIENIHIYRYKLPANADKFTSYITEYSVALLKTFWLSLVVLLRHGFDVIHAANPPDLFFLIGLFYRLLGKKFVFDQHDLAPDLFHAKFKGRKKLLYGLQLFLERCSYHTANLVITTNESQRGLAIGRGRCPADRVFVVRNGPDLERLKLITPEPVLGTGQGHLLAYVGKMGVQDGVEYTLYALNELLHKRGRRDVSLVLMGDGECISALQTLAHQLQLDEYVNFTGWITSSDVPRYLAVADVGLVPDPQNGLNEYSTMIKTMEYMAMGKPVVAFDLAETRFSAQEAALYATPNLVEDFANKIEVLLDNVELRRKMGAMGRKRIVEELNWNHSKKNLLLAYEKISACRSEPSNPSVWDSVTDAVNNQEPVETTRPD